MVEEREKERSRRETRKEKKKKKRWERKRRKKRNVTEFFFPFQFYSLPSFFFFSTTITIAHSSTRKSSPSLFPLITSDATSPTTLLPLRWSTTTPRLKLYVLTFSERSPQPTCPFLSPATRAAEPSSAAPRSLRSSSASALARLRCCDLPERTTTVVCVGRWTARTAESVVLACCPPLPDERIVSIRTSSGLSGR